MLQYIFTWIPGKGEEIILSFKWLLVTSLAPQKKWKTFSFLPSTCKTTGLHSDSGSWVFIKTNKQRNGKESITQLKAWSSIRWIINTLVLAEQWQNTFLHFYIPGDNELIQGALCMKSDFWRNTSQYNWEFVIANPKALNLHPQLFFFLWLVSAYPVLQ